MRTAKPHVWASYMCNERRHALCQDSICVGRVQYLSHMGYKSTRATATSLSTLFKSATANMGTREQSLYYHHYFACNQSLTPLAVSHRQRKQAAPSASPPSPWTHWPHTPDTSTNLPVLLLHVRAVSSERATANLETRSSSHSFNTDNCSHVSPPGVSHLQRRLVIPSALPPSPWKDPTQTPRTV